MFWRSEKIVVLLRSKGIDFYRKNGVLVKKTEYVPEQVLALDVRDKDKFRQWVEELVEKNFSKVIILVGQEAEFTKEVVGQDSNIHELWSIIPISEGNLGKKVIVDSDEKKLLIGTNKQLFELIIQGFANKKVQVEAVLSETGIKHKFGSVGVEQVWKNLSKWRKYDYLVDKDISNVEKKSSKVGIKVAAVVCGILIIAGLIVGGGWWYISKFILKDIEPQTGVIEKTVEPSPTSGVEITSTVDKTEMRITILNATGIRGLAGALKTEFVNSGWTNVEVGTLDETDTSINQVLFPKNIDDGVKSEMLTLLSKALGDVDELAATDSADSQVVVKIEQQGNLIVE